MSKLFLKIFISTMLAVILLSSLILFFSIKSTRSFYIEAIKDELTNLNYTAEDKFIDFLTIQDITGLKSYVERLGESTAKRITLIDTSGVVISDSESKPELMDNHKLRPEVADALNNKIGYSIRYSSTVSDEMLYIAFPIKNNGSILAVSRFSVFLSNIDNLISQIAYNIIKITILVILIWMIGIFIFTKNMIKPINDLSLASQSVAEGNFEAKVTPKGNDEIFHLSKNFNHMTDELSHLFTQVHSQKEEYHILISSIQEGLLVIDFNDNIILSNMSFNNFAKTNAVMGKKYYDILDDDILEEIVDEIKFKNQNLLKEVIIDNKILLISANKIESKNEIVLLFHDITEIKNLERIKKDFVINVSHELRTPLTAIKGFIETLEDEIEDDTNLRYIQIVRRHTDRLINIVQDLLILSEIEETNTKLLFTKIELKFLLENLILIFDQKLKNKNLELILDIEDDFPKLKVDSFRLEQVFINLVDNALKYTDQGYIKIKAEVSEDNQAVIKVSDSGIGIAKEDTYRVFERFYLVDKSRSGKVGGSGLGLSIVKHIIQLHKGSIDVESEKNKGTTFIIRLPINQ